MAERYFIGAPAQPKQKPRLMWIAPSPLMQASFGQVSHELLSRLDNYDTLYLGQNYYGSPRRMGNYTLASYSNGNQLLYWLNLFKPEITVMYQSQPYISLFNSMAKIIAEKTKLVLYIPVESTPCQADITPFLKEAKLFMVPSFWSQTCLKKQYSLDSEVVYHGCFSAETKILCINGKYVPIRKLVRNKSNSKIVGFKGGKFVSTKIIDTFEIPLHGEYMLRLETESGKVLEVTRDNEILTPNGWTISDSIKRNDYIGVYPQQDIHGYKSFIEKTLDRKGTWVPTTDVSLREQRNNYQKFKSPLGRHSPESIFYEYEKNAARNILCRTPRRVQTRLWRPTIPMWNHRRRRSLLLNQNEAEKSFRSHTSNGYSESERETNSMVTREDTFYKRGAASREERVWWLGLPPIYSRFSPLSTFENDGTISNSETGTMQAIDEVYRITNEKECMSGLLRGRDGNSSTDIKIEWGKVTKRERIFKDIVYDLKTGTGNFIANGFVVHNCDMGMFKPMSKPDVFSIGSISSNVWRKQITRMIDAHRIAEQKGFQIPCLLVSSTYDASPWLPELTAYIQQTKSTVKISDAAYMNLALGQPDIAVFYNRMHIHMLPSTEAFGLPNVEGMASGTVPLVVDHGANAEVVGDCGIYAKVAGYLDISIGKVALVDVEDLAEKIIWAKTNPEKLKQLADKGLERAKIFSWEAAEQKLEKILAKL